MTDQSTFEPGLPDNVRVLAGPGQGELTEQRSRFLAFAFPAPDEAAAREAIARVAAKSDLSNDVREVVTRALAE